MNSLSFEDILNRDGVLAYTNVGVSMLPLLREHRDVMIIEKATDNNYRKYDAVLFRRPGVKGRGEYVLHRILVNYGNGIYFIAGDNCTAGENVSSENILGVLSGIVKNGKTVSVDSLRIRLYVNLWCKPYHIRFALLRGKHLIRRILSKIKRSVIRPH